MKLLVGIPTHRRPDLLRKCLESIAAQEGDLPSTAVFVADNDPARREGCELVEELADNFRFPISATMVEEPGISAVRNAILDEARRCGADFIAMIDDDETASPHWLAKLLEAQAAYGADVVGGATIRDPVAGAPKWALTPDAFNASPQPTGPVECIDSTSNILLNCAALERSGWPKFDPAFGLSGGEDAEYFLRLKRAGLSFMWASEATTAEPVPASRVRASWFLKRQFRYGNIGYRLGQMYGIQRTPGRLWAFTNLAATPFLALIAINPRLRAKALRRLGYSAGIVSALFGRTFLEYSDRHTRS